MSVKYCKYCGAKNSYIGVEPKFCSHCGEPFGSKKLVKRITRGSIANSKNVSNDVNNDDTTNMDYVPNISRLQYDVDIAEKKTFTFEEIAGMPPNESRPTEEKG